MANGSGVQKWTIRLDDELAQQFQEFVCRRYGISRQGALETMIAFIVRRIELDEAGEPWLPRSLEEWIDLARKRDDICRRKL